MRLTSDARAILGQGPIGMLALRAGRLPMVNPAVFSFASGSLWMTTSRFAAKTVLARRDPRAAFLIDGGSRARRTPHHRPGENPPRPKGRAFPPFRQR